MSCRSAINQATLIRACAACEQDKPEAERLLGQNVTHGICRRHQLLLCVPDLLTAIARLEGPEHLSRDARGEMLRRLRLTLKIIERVAMKPGMEKMEES